jgi:hypothetical protein
LSKRGEKMQAYKKWAGLRLEVIQYCKEKGISESDFRLLGIYEWQNVYDRLLKMFVDEEYAKNCGLYWSNIEAGFRKEIQKIYSFEEGSKNHASYEWIEKLPQIVECEKIYLFLEEKKQTAKYWIAECSPAIVHLIVNDAIAPTDYYITNKKFDWLITENHHDIVQFIGKGLDINTIKAVCTK